MNSCTNISVYHNNLQTYIKQMTSGRIDHVNRYPPLNQ